jgi:uncharacterized protein (UPF0548 family)
MAKRSTASADNDLFGIARYLEAAVVDGEIRMHDAAEALHEWADHDDRVLARAAARSHVGSGADVLLHVAAAPHRLHRHAA